MVVALQVSTQKQLALTQSNTLNLILPILPKLPPEFFTMDPPLKMVFNADDGPRGQTQ